MGKRPRGPRFNPYHHMSGPPPNRIIPVIGAMRTAMQFAANAPGLDKIQQKFDEAVRAGWRVPDVWIERIQGISKMKIGAALPALAALHMPFTREVQLPKGWTHVDVAGALFVIHSRIVDGKPIFPEA